MKITRKVWASIATLLAACLVHAADTKMTGSVMRLIDIETDDPSGYAMWIADYNQIAKAKLGVDRYLRVFQSGFDGEKISSVRVASYGASVAELTKNAAALENDPGILNNRTHLDRIRKMGSHVLYKAVRHDGRVLNASIYWTLAVVNDEPGYLKALDQLRGLFDANGLKDVNIIVWRVLAGRTNHTHRIVISTPSPERLAALLDTTSTNQAMNDWIASSAKFRTVVSNGTSREITK